MVLFRLPPADFKSFIRLPSGTGYPVGVIRLVGDPGVLGISKSIGVSTYI